MAKIIVTSRYLKSGARGNLKNYVKYIATRLNAVHNSAPATEKQRALIASLIQDFPDCMTTAEYLQYAAKGNYLFAIEETLRENAEIQPSIALSDNEVTTPESMPEPQPSAHPGTDLLRLSGTP